MRRAASTIVLAGLLCVGCGSVPLRDSFEDASVDLEERTGQRLEWSEVSIAASELDGQVADLLAKPLDADSAVALALLNNRGLQARYAALGQAVADRVQAGLLPNPFLEVVATFRDGEGRPTLEISLVQEVLELFMLPARKRLAAVELERAELEMAAAVIDQIAATRVTFIRYQAEQQLLELDRHALLAVEAAWEMAVQLREAGNISELDLLVERDFYEQVRLEVAERERTVLELREQLNQRLGLWGARGATWSAEERLPELPSTVAATAEVESRAVSRSLDLAIGLLDIEAAARRSGIRDLTSWLPELEAGIEGERESERSADGTTHDEWSYGPSLGLSLPIFDQGQPRRVSAGLELRRRWDELAALGVEVRSVSRRAATRLLFAEQRARALRDVLLPLRSALTAESQLHYNGMFLGVFQLLDAKRRELDAARSYVTALRDYWLAESGLEQLASGRLPGGDTGGFAELDGGAMMRGEGAEEGH